MAQIMRGLFLVTLSSWARGSWASQTRDPQARPWLNQDLPVDSRVALLLGNMTLDEKVAQLTYGE